MGQLLAHRSGDGDQLGWAAMTQRRSTHADGRGYRLGLWLDSPAVRLVGSEGAASSSAHAAGAAAWSVLGNTTIGAWSVWPCCAKSCSHRAD